MSEEAPPPRGANGRGRAAITVRVPGPLLRRIDRYIESRDVPNSCDNRLLDAAVEKPDRQQAPREDRDGA